MMFDGCYRNKAKTGSWMEHEQNMGLKIFVWSIGDEGESERIIDVMTMTNELIMTIAIVVIITVITII